MTTMTMLSFACLLLLLSHAISATTPEVDLGTTLVALCYKDGVVVGADTRTSVGSYVSNRYANKIGSLSPEAVVCRSGSAADTQYIAEKWQLNVLRGIIVMEHDRISNKLRIC